MMPTLHIGAHALSSYALCAILGALSGAALAWPALRRCGLRGARAALLLAALAVAFLVGARLWNVAINPLGFTGAVRWYTLRWTGLSLYGGILGAFVVLVFALWLRKTDPWPVLDALVLPGAIAFMIARVGCFLAGCCAGRITTLPWGVMFPSKGDNTPPAILGGLLPFLSEPRHVHPTQLYELLGAAAALGVALAATTRRSSPSGARFLLFGSLFCLMRLLVLPLRVLPYSDTIKNVAYPALYLALIAGGCCCLLRLRRGER